MKVPTALLRQRITIEPFEGESAYGPVYGTAVENIPARFDGQRRTVRKADGTDLIASGTVIVRPDVTVAAQSRVTIDSTVYEVVDVVPGQGLSRPSHLEVLVS